MLASVTQEFFSTRIKNESVLLLLSYVLVAGGCSAGADAQPDCTVPASSPLG